MIIIIGKENRFDDFICNFILCFWDHIRDILHDSLYDLHGNEGI